MDLRGDRRVNDVLMVDISRLYRVELANIAPSSISGHDAMSGTLVVIARCQCVRSFVLGLDDASLSCNCFFVFQ